MADELKPIKGLDMAEETDEWSLSVGELTSYREPSGDPAAGAELKVAMRADRLPGMAFVAPSDVGQEAKNPNTIRMPKNQFIFMDVGRWLKDSRAQARDFGLVWGRHVYLCGYRRNGYGPPRYSREGLDAEFFRAMGNSTRPLKRASASWSVDADFDWDHVYVITADMHLMGPEQAAKWYGDHARYMEPERDFWDFALRLSRAVSAGPLQGKVKYVQIGDAYDLWVGCKPAMFESAPDTRKVVVKPEAAATVTSWVRRIQGLDKPAAGDGGNWVYSQLNTVPPLDELNALPDPLPMLIKNRVGEFTTPEWHTYVEQAQSKVWLNPAVAALRMLEASLGIDNVEYVYGNHDNYLADRGVSDAAGLRPRKRFSEPLGTRIFIEHGHRMEVPEVVTHPPGAGYNSDGMCAEAWAGTNDYYDFLTGEKSSFTGWVESNVQLPQESMPKFAPTWAKVASLVMMAPIEIVGGVVKWALGLVGLGGSTPGHVPVDIAWTSWFDQPWFIQEYARVCIGRRYSVEFTPNPPNIFVIGHTHLPMLAKLNIARE